jgi:hypothetical protein
MKKLEETIRLHRELADYREPFSGHERRFLNKAEKKNPKGKNIHYMVGLLAVASLMTAVIIIPGLLSRNQNTDIANLPQEIKDAIFYYESMSEEIYENIYQIKSDDKSEFNRIKGDIESFEKWNTLIMNDYRSYPDDERVRNALIEFHKNKAEMLNDIYMQIKSNDYEMI